MVAVDTLLEWPSLVLLIAILVLAALAHGTLGFGFPVISTPMVALMTDVQTAVLVTLFPNLAVNLISTIRGGDWRESIARYWPVAIYVLLGTVIGTQVLLVTDPGPIKLLLAAMIVVYLEQKRFRGLDWSWLHRHPQLSGAGFGLLAGFLSGTVNVALPPLIIYFMALGLAPVAMTQILNLCFLVGRSTQAVTFGISGHVGLSTLVATLPLTIISIVVLAIGVRIQSRIRPEVFQGLLRKVLWLMAVILVVQVLWQHR
ncbi:MAG: sulfite exporter TauE/SafE family protein [Roseiflexaceae bacterium]